MSTLSEINEQYRRCPLCKTYLALSVKTVNEVLKYTDQVNYISVEREIAGWQMSPKSYRYKIEMLIDVKTNEFSIDFKDDKGLSLPYVTNTHMKNYIQHYENKVSDRLYFTRKCVTCNNFYCVTGLVSLDHKKGKLQPISVNSEYFYFYRKDLNKHYYVCNRLGTETTSLDVIQGDYGYGIERWAGMGESYVSIPLLKLNFEDLNKVYQKIDTLMLFS